MMKRTATAAMTCDQERELVSLVSWLETFPSFTTKLTPLLLQSSSSTSSSTTTPTKGASSPAVPSSQQPTPPPSHSSTPSSSRKEPFTALNLLCSDVALTASSLKQQQPLQVDVMDQLIDALSSLETSRDILRVAEEICETSESSEEHNKGATTSSSQQNSNSDQIWTSLLVLTSTKARPVMAHHQKNSHDTDHQSDDTKMSPARLKLYVLSNLLDCAVQCPNLRQRRTYIERIMALSKPVQKTLMVLIERRASRSPTPSKHATPPKSAHKSSLSSKSSRQTITTATTASSSVQSSVVPSVSTVRSPSPLPPTTEAQSFHGTPNRRSSVRTPEVSLTPMEQTPVADTNRGRDTDKEAPEIRSPPVNRSTMSRGPESGQVDHSDLKTSSTRLHSAAFSPNPSGYTPQPKRSSAIARSLADEALLSPGTLESPSRVQNIVWDLKGQNHDLMKRLETLKGKEDALLQKMEAMEATHRKEMIQVESKATQREDELTIQFEELMEELQKELQDALQRAERGEQARQELEAAREQLDLHRHDSQALADATEKLRKYREKMVELEDMQQALRREQEVHGRAVDEIVRLENEVQSLQPLKRQVEEYKIRAIEAEVKLVECQDYLRRLEQQATDQSATNDYLWKGSMMQQEQLDELQRRIQMDMSSNELEGLQGIGSGVNELNPEIKAELVRLRNENIQLRAFADKRQSDSVQKLEEKLEDAKLLSDRYKTEYLSTKQALERSQNLLAESQERESNLIKEVAALKEEKLEADARIQTLQPKLDMVHQELVQTKKYLEASEMRNADLENDVEDWIRKMDEAESLSKERHDRIQHLTRDLHQTRSELGQAEAQVKARSDQLQDLEQELARQQEEKEKYLSELQRVREELSTVSSQLEESQRLAETLDTRVKRLTEERTKLSRELDETHRSKLEAIQEAHQSLEATRAVLTTKAKKELEDLQANMNKLLEDERKAYRQKDEESSRALADLEAKWQVQYAELQERSTLTLKHSREEAQERIDFVKQEYQGEIAAVRKEALEAREKLIQQGKAMIQEAKTKAEKEFTVLEEERRTLEEELAKVNKEKDELDQTLRGKIVRLKQRVDFTTAQVSDMTKEAFDLQEQVKALEREKFKLQEDNDRYRRQLGGRYGADGKVQMQLEKLQKEYNALLEENRNLKKQARHPESRLGAISESSLGLEGDTVGYRSATLNGSTLSTIRREYEETIEALNDEKRELVMRHSAAITDVQKAEQRAWEREQEVARLKSENTSLKLVIARAEISQDQEPMAEERFSKELSFLSAREERTPERASRSPGGRDSGSKRPPSIEKAMREKANQENILRSRLTSFSSTHGTPERQPQRLERPSVRDVDDSHETVLSPTSRHHQAANTQSEEPRAVFQPSQSSKLAAEVFWLSNQQPSQRGNGQPSLSHSAQTLMNLTRLNEPRLESDERPECKQS